MLAKQIKIPTVKVTAVSHLTTQKHGHSPSEDTKGKKAKMLAVPSLGGSESSEPESLNFGEL